MLSYEIKEKTKQKTIIENYICGDQNKNLIYIHKARKQGENKYILDLPNSKSHLYTKKTPIFTKRKK